MAIAISILLALITAWFLMAPWFHPLLQENERGQSGYDFSLVDQKGRCLQVLRDLELDYATGKLAEGDYIQTKEQLQLELAALLTQLNES